MKIKPSSLKWIPLIFIGAYLFLGSGIAILAPYKEFALPVVILIAGGVGFVWVRRAKS